MTRCSKTFWRNSKTSKGQHALLQQLPSVRYNGDIYTQYIHNVYRIVFFWSTSSFSIDGYVGKYSLVIRENFDRLGKTVTLGISVITIVFTSRTTHFKFFNSISAIKRDGGDRKWYVTIIESMFVRTKVKLKIKFQATVMLCEIK